MAPLNFPLATLPAQPDNTTDKVECIYPKTELAVQALPTTEHSTWCSTATKVETGWLLVQTVFQCHQTAANWITSFALDASSLLVLIIIITCSVVVVSTPTHPDALGSATTTDRPLSGALLSGFGHILSVWGAIWNEYMLMQTALPYANLIFYIFMKCLSSTNTRGQRLGDTKRQYVERRSS